VLSGGTRRVQVGTTSYVVNRYVLKNGFATAIAYYWYEGRGRVEASEYRVKWNLLRDAALLGHTEEALVRLIVPINAPVVPTSPAAQAVYDRADAFAEPLVARLIRDVRQALPRARVTSG
jgi:hypothetical protein